MTAPRPSRAADQVSQQLSQVDIDRMMLGGSPERPATPRHHPPDVQVYDFRRPHRVS
jgi:hypothetical protein